MIEVERVKPSGLFTNYIFKAIPLAFDESMSYYETLCGLLKYMQDTMIPALNNNADAIAELQALQTQLQEYVDNYFDNLDVQEEINNKLDEMAKDGSLSSLIERYVDPYFDYFNDRINQQNDLINSVVSGNPKGVYPTYADLVSANPDHDYIYIVTENGNWYYYSTLSSSWTSGGTYQSSMIADGSITPQQTNFLSLSGENKFLPRQTTENGITVSYDYESFKTSISGTSSVATTRYLLLKTYLTAGVWSIRAFDYTGVKNSIYGYTESDYNNQNWGTNIGLIGRNSYAGNVTVESDGYIYFVLYTTANDTLNYEGKLILSKNPYTSVTTFTPIQFTFSNSVTVNTKTNYWRNKDLVAYGDSLTDWGTWKQNLTNMYGINVANYGIAGTTAAIHGDNYGCLSSRIATLPQSADVVTILFGTNDYAYAIPLGTVPDEIDDNTVLDETTYAGALLSICKQLTNKYPTARFIIMTPPFKATRYNGHILNWNGDSIADYGKIVKDVALLMGFDVVDLLNDMNVNIFNYTNYSQDGIHFNDYGYQRMAQLLTDKLNTFIPTDNR